MIRVFLVDDHPALRAGLHTVLRAEPGIVPVGAAESAEEALARIEQVSPDVALLDYHLPGEDGLLACRRITSAESPPRVLIYSAYATAELAVPAILAGAHGIASKASPADELLDAVRMVARGSTVLPPLSRDVIQASAEKLDPESELPVFGMLMDGTPVAEVAKVLGIERADVVERTRVMLGKLRLPVSQP